MPFKFRDLFGKGARQTPASDQAAGEEIPFFRYGRDPKCDPEIAHTIVELIETVASDFKDDSWYWDSFDKRIDQKRKKNYRAKVNPAHLDEAWELLKAKTWLSLQNVNAQKKISTLEPLDGLQNVENLILSENAVSDISVLAGMTQLKKLHLTSNRVQDMSALSACQLLRNLEIGDNPVKSLAPLENLPQLASLMLSRDQLPALYQCKALPTLRSLRLWGEFKESDPAPDFRKFPEMPELRSLQTDGVQDLVGIERFSQLSAIDLWGDSAGASFGLDCLARLGGLMDITVRSYGDLDVSPLAACLRLRFLNFMAATLTGLNALKRLPVLHEVLISEGRTEHDAMEANSLRDGLSSWDTEFAADVPRPSPNFEIEIVSQVQFDRFDSKQAFGIDPTELDDVLLRHERDWLLGRIEDALQVDLTPEEDFVVPTENRDARSHTVVILSLKAYESVRSIVAAIQAQLCSSKKDWIIYFQALPDEGPDADELPKNVKNFTAWIYPEKIVATKTDAAVISRLLVP